MATRLGLLRAQGRVRSARLLYGQQKLCSSTSSTGNCTSGSSSVRLLARLSSSDAAAVGSNSVSSRSSSSSSASGTSVQRVLRASTRGKFSPLFPGGSCSSRAPFSTRPSSTTKRDDAHRSSTSTPAVLTFGGVSNADRLAELDDGDKYEDFVDLRLKEAEKLFPEGLAGGGQGALERAASRGTSTALLRREAADALIHSLDDFAAAAAAEQEEEEGGAPFGIKGTSSENWRETCEARQYGMLASAGEGGEGDGGAGGENTGMAAAARDSPHDGDGNDDDYDDIAGDVRAAAAEGAAAAVAAAAAAEAVMVAAVTAADNAGGEGSELEGGGGGGAETDKQEKVVLGSGPIWEEMKALAESKRKPLKGVRRVVVRPGQRSYLLTGRRGSGKSCVLNQAVLHARSTGWIVLFVPDGRNLVQKGIYCQPSTVHEGLYDLPVQSLKRLQTLRDAHGDQLKEISIKDPEVLSRHEGAKTLLDVMDKGLADEASELAGTAHYDVMRELLATTEAKVMLAIDEYNELFQMSHWHYGDNKASFCFLEAPHLTATLPLVPPLVSTGTGLAFEDESLATLANPKVSGRREAAAAATWLDAETGAACLPPPPVNGIVVCAVSGRYPPVKKLRKKKKWTPFEVMAGRLANAVSIPVEPYTRCEFSRVVKRYARVEEVVNEPLGTMEVAKLHAKSDRIPEHVFEVCRAGRYRTVVHD
ncbi:unnamed protein product [Pylaiella littoralis]